MLQFLGDQIILFSGEATAGPEARFELGSLPIEKQKASPDERLARLLSG